MYNSYSEDIFRYLLVHVRDVQVAEDLTSDTFTKAWKNIKKYDFKHPRGWLYTIARNTLTDYWRKRKTVPLDEEIELVDEEAPSHDDLLDKEIELKKVAEIMHKLPTDMKSVVVLRFMQGYSARKTAEALGMSESNVRVVQFRALKRMRGQLK